jgi:hypothetical protein
MHRFLTYPANPQSEELIPQSEEFLFFPGTGGLFGMLLIF